MLLCAVSRALPGEPSLTTSFDNNNRPEERCASYVIIETSERLYLARKLPHEADDASSHDGKVVILTQGFGLIHTVADQFRSTWARRPFQYSGAINLDAALVIVDMLMDALRGKIESETTIRLLDPICGTVLALALFLHCMEESLLGDDGRRWTLILNSEHLFLTGSPSRATIQHPVGGWGMKLTLARAMLLRADLLMDEPRITSTSSTWRG
jgi:hypothetical protein